LPSKKKKTKNKKSLKCQRALEVFF